MVVLDLLPVLYIPAWTQDWAWVPELHNGYRWQKLPRERPPPSPEDLERDLCKQKSIGESPLISLSQSCPETTHSQHHTMATAVTQAFKIWRETTFLDSKNLGKWTHMAWRMWGHQHFCLSLLPPNFPPLTSLRFSCSIPRATQMGRTV